MLVMMPVMTPVNLPATEPLIRRWTAFILLQDGGRENGEPCQAWLPVPWEVSRGLSVREALVPCLLAANGGPARQPARNSEPSSGGDGALERAPPLPAPGVAARAARHARRDQSSYS